MRKRVSLALVDGVAVGDYVIVHVGYALTRLDPEEAERTLALFAEAGWRHRRRSSAMKYIDEFRDGSWPTALAAAIAREAQTAIAATA